MNNTRITLIMALLFFDMAYDKPLWLALPLGVIGIYWVIVAWKESWRESADEIEKLNTVEGEE